MSDKLSAEEVGVMIRARRLLKSKGLDPDADVSTICKAAGVSRKTGYQWAEKHAASGNARQTELEEHLKQLQTTHDQLKKDYEWVSFVNRAKALAWDLHDVDEMIAAKKKNFEPEKKRQAVAFLRTEDQSLSTLCWLLQVSIGTLVNWNRSFDEHLQAYVVEDRRGRAGKVTTELVRQVVTAAKQQMERGRRLRMKTFVKYLKEHLGVTVGRTTVEQILIANDLRNVRTRHKRPQFYQSLCRRIPNGLVSLDGSQMTVWLDDQPFAFNVELAVDVTSFCHTGMGVHDSETARAVVDALEKHRVDWGAPLGVVFDNGTANLSGEVAAYLAAHGIEPIAVGPANPKGNGTDEGAFSQMKRMLGPIRLNGSSPQALARSVLETLVSVYIRMRNRLARVTDSIAPREQMELPVSEMQRDTERERLQQFVQARNVPSEDSAKLDRLQFIVTHHGLSPDPKALDRAQKCIRYYTMEAIAESEQAFVKAVERNSSRCNMPYFFGILKNVQQRLDDERYRQYCRERYNHTIMCENERRRQEYEQEQAPPSVDLIASMAANAITATRRYLKNLATRKVAEWVAQLLASVRYTRSLWKQFVDAVGDMQDLSIEQRQKALDVIERAIALKSEEESVTRLA